MSSLPPAQEHVDHPISQPPIPTTPPSSLTRPWSSICSKGSLMVKLVKNHGCHLTRRNELIKEGPRQGPIDTLTDGVLLRIFDFYLSEAQPTLGGFKEINAWFTLVHVYQRWRNFVFASSRRLGLQLVCTARTPVTKKLDVWPALPIVVSQHALKPEGVQNIVAALKHTDRVCGINLDRISYWVLDKVLAVMQQPFPALKDLYLVSNTAEFGTRKIPDSFLGGSTPHLRSLQLGGIEFQGLSNLLLSAVSLVTLSLWSVPRFVPPPSSTRFVFPALTRFMFQGYKQYLEDFVAQVDAPILSDIFIKLLYPDTSGIPRLAPLISCPVNLKAPDNAVITFWYKTVSVKFRLPSGYETLRLKIEYYGPDSNLGLSYLARICGSSLPPLPTVERLYVTFASHGRHVQNGQWLDLLYPFTALNKLYLSEELEPVRQGAIKVLPTLQDIFSESQLQEAIPQPFTPRQLFSYHIVREPDASERPPMTGLMPLSGLPFIPHVTQL